MLLAGGQGSRLGALTRHVAKPAVHFGGKYRIIDFTLSNCVNSGIDTVGVLTQYKPLELNDYIGNGQPWGLDRNRGGVHILQPYTKINSKSWYEGTANAIFQNLAFIERYRPDYVLILSGDHIYRMDYSVLVAYHEEQDADCTIAVIDVPPSEASRFGIMNTDEHGQIVEFEEKPKKPKSTKASMGVYVFSRDMLKKYLTKDNELEKSAHDFGKNIIPAMLQDKKRLFAWEFHGYWKDVGTTDSLWEANMDLLNPDCDLYVGGDDLRIYARNENNPPTFVAEDAVLKDSIITKGCCISGDITSSVISGGCVVESGAQVTHAVLLPGVRVASGALVQYAIVGQNTHIEAGASVGEVPNNLEHPHITVIGERKKIAGKTAS
ncbi:MAG: glucose-1-phosphate adenylyltransferase [Ruminococcaceae bacterium]|nr:glucose-1-phosphate adenylyltransferase [Oscillospiraceae bacterium]